MFFFPLQSRQGRAIEQINIRKAVPVIIKDRHAARRHFENVILRRRARVMFEVRQGCLVRGVFENHWCFRIGNASGSS